MTSQRILIAGIGNIFLGDDGFGTAVAQRMAQRVWPEGVQVVDFGIRGIDLAYALLDGYDATIMVDAVARGGTPGTLYVIQPEVDALSEVGPPAIETHGMDPVKVLRMVKALGGNDLRGLDRLLIVGCEPETLGPEEGQFGLSATVERAVDAVIPLIESLIERIVTEGQPRLPADDDSLQRTR